MPLYDYKCQEHGLFHQLNTLEKSAQPVPCPECNRASARVIVIPPEILAMSPAKRKAMARNEQFKHEPLMSKQLESIASPSDHHKCCDGHTHKSSALHQKAILLADGSKIFPSQRPWMISH